jgi:hypothetical protein
MSEGVHGGNVWAFVHALQLHERPRVHRLDLPSGHQPEAAAITHSHQSRSFFLPRRALALPPNCPLYCAGPYLSRSHCRAYSRCTCSAAMGRPGRTAAAATLVAADADVAPAEPAAVAVLEPLPGRTVGVVLSPVAGGDGPGGVSIGSDVAAAVNAAAVAKAAAAAATERLVDPGAIAEEDEGGTEAGVAARLAASGVTAAVAAYGKGRWP